MPDLTGGQLTFDCPAGPFNIVTDDWWPEDDGLAPLWFGIDLDDADTQVGLGDWILNETGWAPTVIQIPMLFLGDFESHLNVWRTELTDPTVVARAGTLLMPSGETRTAVGSKFQLSRRGKLRPAGWPLLFEFQLTAPFAP